MTPTTSKTGSDWLTMKSLIFETDDLLKKVSSEGLFLFLIGIDLKNLLAGEKGKEFHLLLALGHNKRQMSGRFPDEDVRAELRKALNSSLPDGGKLELMKPPMRQSIFILMAFSVRALAKER
ncbi:uncharacterized protein ColSpa_12215 [Colletotrichum spaethianum]|uniref:Uncharacterized protein n=1 Tax=Colletotrichum spaethianum TaxID=700344 RepID=A0AA37UL00_9PEZI|nr:uncharacterized protein ColSpa_12215 [Colletotrichum spaethianum]GKT52034.1 hypothetical protein ColSpa_12215 [Colletotrichum spaethianum]